jgi:hypothetical protein
VPLLILVRKSYKVVEKEILIPKMFEASKTPIYTKPQKYNVLEYQIETSKL